MGKLKVLDLFSGIGGFSLGLERIGGFETIAFCEIEPFPRKVLQKHWPDVPIFEDVRTLHATDLPRAVDVICGGYPCQPFSLAGKRQGAEDDRHLWPEIDRLLREFSSTGKKPSWCVFENVAGHINMGLDSVLADLEGQGYTAWPLVIPACAVDAPHRRDRVWIVAHAENIGRVQSENVQELKDGAAAFRAGDFVPTRGITIDRCAEKRRDRFFIPNSTDTRVEGVRQREDGVCESGTMADATQQLLDRGGDTGEDGGHESANTRGNAPHANQQGLEERSRRGSRNTHPPPYRALSVAS